MTKTLKERIADLERDILRSNKGELDSEEVSGTFEIATEIITELQVSLKHFKTTSDDFRDNMLAYKEEAESIGEIVNNTNLKLVDQIRNLQAENQALLAKNSEVERALEELKYKLNNPICDVEVLRFKGRNLVKALEESKLLLRERYSNPEYSEELLADTLKNLVNALETEKEVTQEHYDLEAVTRLEIIGNNGRCYVNSHTNPMEFSYQDDGKTLKIFCGNKEDMSKPEPKIDIKEERVEPVSIWKDVSESVKEYDLDQGNLVLANMGGKVTLEDIEHVQMEFGKHQECCIYEKYATLTDFVNSIEQMQKDIEELKRKSI